MLSILKPGDRVRHKAWKDSPARIGIVRKVFVWRPAWPGVRSHVHAEIEWPRPEGNGNHNVEWLELIS